MRWAQPDGRSRRGMGMGATASAGPAWRGGVCVRCPVSESRVWDCRTPYGWLLCTIARSRRGMGMGGTASAWGPRSATPCGGPSHAADRQGGATRPAHAWLAQAVGPCQGARCRGGCGGVWEQRQGGGPAGAAPGRRRRPSSWSCPWTRTTGVAGVCVGVRRPCTVCGASSCSLPGHHARA